VRTLLIALFLALLSPAAARADVLPEPGEGAVPQQPARPEPGRSGCGRKPGELAHDVAALLLAGTFSLLLLAGRKKLDRAA